MDTALLAVKSPKTRPVRAKALTQIIELQDRAYQIATDRSVKETVACFAMRSFCSLQEERRKLTMQPLPKPVDVSKLGKGKRKAQAGPAYQEPGPNPGPEVAQSTSTAQPRPKQSPDNQGK